MALEPKVAISDNFMQSFARISRKEQQGVMGFVAKFRQNPRATGINYETIHDAADPNMRSVRISQKIRAIILKPAVGDVYCLLWVDQHDAAYSWAQRHKVAIHPDSGSMQLYAVDHRVEVPESGVSSSVGEDRADITQVPAPRMFERWSDAEIRSLGVPDEFLSHVRAVVDDDGLEALETLLPDEAFETLYLLAAGEDLEQILAERAASDAVDTQDFAAALERDGSRRHFLVLTDDADLDALLAAPLERWRVFLHPSQRKLVSREWSGPVKVTGGAGTGKTVVAMHRARWLAKKYQDLPGRPVVFTTFTRTLADDIEWNLKQLCSPQELAKIQVINLDRWAVNFLGRTEYAFKPLYEEKKRREYWDRAVAACVDLDFDALLPGIRKPAVFLRAEYERVILPQGCESADDYMRAKRAGRGGKLGRLQKKNLWRVFAEYRKLLEDAGLREPEEVFRDACRLIDQERMPLGIRSMVIDEGQDISAAAYALIRAAVPAADNDLFIVGDAHQRIYRHKVVLGRIGIEVRGRSQSLKLNYRTTDEIRRWACATLKGVEVDDLDGNVDTLQGYRSLTHGDHPEVIPSASVQEDVRHVRRLLEQTATSGIEARKVCVTVRTNEVLHQLSEEFKAQNVEFLALGNAAQDDPSVPGIRLATMHRVKGLEFDVVVLAGYEGAAHHAARISRDEDAGVVEAAENAERCLLHVAATRARRQLLVLERK
ncbi:MAG: AAA family ATPase [Lautropia sp.]|nr:AAA family ATPase [Lautropia sp.]